MSSIVANATGKEYLWQADPAFWKRHSPVLFPIVGSVWKAEYRNEGTVYPLSQHGFARDMDFTLIDEAENELRFALESTPDTLRAYPFPFLLEIGYRLEGNKVEVLWRVKNTGDKTMHFQIGVSVSCTLMGMWETGGLYLCLEQSGYDRQRIALYRSIRHIRDYKGGYNQFLTLTELQKLSYPQLLERLSMLRKDGTFHGAAA